MKLAAFIALLLSASAVHAQNESQSGAVPRTTEPRTPRQIAIDKCFRDAPWDDRNKALQDCIDRIPPK